MPLKIEQSGGEELATVRYPTPGPVSTGDPEAVAAQRADLGLSDDPSGMSDAADVGRRAETGAPDEEQSSAKSSSKSSKSSSSE
jgi:hypothetical protein